MVISADSQESLILLLQPDYGFGKTMPLTSRNAPPRYGVARELHQDRGSAARGVSRATMCWRTGPSPVSLSRNVGPVRSSKDTGAAHPTVC